MAATDDTKTIPDVEGMLGETRERFEKEIERLEPAVEAHRRLTSFLATWDKTTSGKRRGRTASANRSGRGERPKAFVEVVKDRPGITVSEAMEDERMSGINRNYLYRLASELRKEGQGYHPVA
jgi:hypothetical protein